MRLPEIDPKGIAKQILLSSTESVAAALERINITEAVEHLKDTVTTAARAVAIDDAASYFFLGMFVAIILFVGFVTVIPIQQ